MIQLFKQILSADTDQIESVMYSNTVIINLHIFLKTHAYLIIAKNFKKFSDCTLYNINTIFIFAKRSSVYPLLSTLKSNKTFVVASLIAVLFCLPPTEITFMFLFGLIFILNKKPPRALSLLIRDVNTPAGDSDGDRITLTPHHHLNQLSGVYKNMTR